MGPLVCGHPGVSVGTVTPGTGCQSHVQREPGIRFVVTTTIPTSTPNPNIPNCHMASSQLRGVSKQRTHFLCTGTQHRWVHCGTANCYGGGCSIHGSSRWSPPHHDAADVRPHLVRDGLSIGVWCGPAGDVHSEQQSAPPAATGAKSHKTSPHPTRTITR